MTKMVVQEGQGDTVKAKDTVFYMHETRFDTGQLVDFGEKRRMKDKFEMGNALYFEYYKQALATMRKGEVAWLVYGPKFHQWSYHRTSHFSKKTPEEQAAIGDKIYLKFSVVGITRNPQCADNKTF